MICSDVNLTVPKTIQVVPRAHSSAPSYIKANTCSTTSSVSDRSLLIDTRRTFLISALTYEVILQTLVMKKSLLFYIVIV